MTQEIRHFRSAVSGSAIRDGRKALRWSLDRLARETGFSVGFLDRVERGGSMSELEAEKIGAALVRGGYKPGVTARATAAAPTLTAPQTATA